MKNSGLNYLDPNIPPPVIFDLVTVLYRSGDSIKDFLRSLKGQDLVAWRVHVVDNAGPDEAARIVAAQADSRIRLISNPRNLGFASVANQGLRAGLAAGGDCFVLINNDLDRLSPGSASARDGGGTCEDGRARPARLAGRRLRLAMAGCAP